MDFGICLMATRVEVKRCVPSLTFPYAPGWNEQVVMKVEGVQSTFTNGLSECVVANDAN